MKKRITAAILTLAMLSMGITGLASEGDKVEISFKVGDSTLNINGVPTEVETPYVAGEGVTLVPLRVITEAFGTQVDWDGDTKSITLTYPGVAIELQIDNEVAKVNDHSETLLEAPVLTENGVTMVPLRFISETFGADVSYDAETAAILVSKEKATDKSTVTGVTDKKRTGDSYYSWSVETPTQMTMTDRRPDGLTTEFKSDAGSELSIDVWTHTEDNFVPFDEQYEKVKEVFSDYTLTEAQKSTNNDGQQYMHFSAKKKDEIIDYIEVYGDSFTTYSVVSHFEADVDSAEKDMVLGIANSFKVGGIDDDTYDLSTVKDGWRTITDEKYKLKFIVPADYQQLTSNGEENSYLFYSKDKKGVVHATVISKNDELNAKSLAEHDLESRKKNANPDLMKFSSVQEMNDGSYRYTVKVEGASGDSDMFCIDSFMEKGDYIYNVSIEAESVKETGKMEKILAGFEAEELDSKEIGKLIRNDSDEDTLVTSKTGDYSIKLPATWKKVMGSVTSGANIGGHLFEHKQTGDLLSVVIDKNADYDAGKVTNEINGYKKYYSKKSDIQVIKDISYVTAGSKKYATMTYKEKINGDKLYYITVYMREVKGELIVVELHEKDIYYQADTRDDVIAALDTLEKAQ